MASGRDPVLADDAGQYRPAVPAQCEPVEVSEVGPLPQGGVDEVLNQVRLLAAATRSAVVGSVSSGGRRAVRRTASSLEGGARLQDPGPGGADGGPGGRERGGPESRIRRRPTSGRF